VLDEPTNHLDIATKEMLIDRAGSNYEGTMLFVSHDRHFLAALSNRVLELTPDGVHPMAAAIPSMSPAPARKRRGCIRAGS
jgi:ATPase subunit of ABC transporter with duplicated ATPase domains